MAKDVKSSQIATQSHHKIFAYYYYAKYENENICAKSEHSLMSKRRKKNKPHILTESMKKQHFWYMQRRIDEFATLYEDSERQREILETVMLCTPA